MTTYDYSINIWSVLLIIAIVNAIALLISFWLQKKKRNTNPYLYLFIVSLIIIFVEHVIEYEQGYTLFPHLIFISAPFFFLLGPLFYLANKSIKSEKEWKAVDLLHFAPSLIVLFIMAPFYMTDAAFKISTIQRLYSSDVIEFSFNHTLILLAFQIQFSAYFILLVTFFRKRMRIAKQYVSKTSLENEDIYKNVLTAFTLFFFFLFLSHYSGLLNSSLFGLFDRIEITSLSFIIYGIGISRLTHIYPVFTEPDSNHEAPGKLIVEEAHTIKKQLRDLVDQEKLYLNPNLRLSDLVSRTGFNKNIISSVINNELNSNFYDFINEFRVNEAKLKLKSEEYKDYSFEAIAEECGFNNYVSFYRVFKKATKMTPTEYMNK